MRNVQKFSASVKEFVLLLLTTHMSHSVSCELRKVYAQMQWPVGSYAEAYEDINDVPSENLDHHETSPSTME
ncbi:hypothetical protein EB796_001201 [Bugula neritina]|uniref:Uncharacterized protein n=1 Tax=Bugula neritina TaxID=10212 RepID=A0A7J7KQS1_BUGNE|nr:hypothetical protein EB796_001201 [Bugula neritina]